MRSSPGRPKIGRMLIGRVGQTSSACDAAVADLHTSCRSRWLGHAKRTCRHLRHTCDNVCHGHISSYRSHSRRQKLNIYRRTSSERASIVTRPTLHQPVIVVETVSGTYGRCRFSSEFLLSLHVLISGTSIKMDGPVDVPGKLSFVISLEPEVGPRAGLLLVWRCKAWSVT
jgi:hypothetical protein